MSIDVDEDTLRLLDAERVTRAREHLTVALTHLHLACEMVSQLPSGRLGADVLRETLPDDLRDATERIGHIAYDLEQYRP